MRRLTVTSFQLVKPRESILDYSFSMSDRFLRRLHDVRSSLAIESGCVSNIRGRKYSLCSFTKRVAILIGPLRTAAGQIDAKFV